MKRKVNFLIIMFLLCFSLCACSESIVFEFAGMYGNEWDETIEEFRNIKNKDSSVNYVFLTDLHTDYLGSPLAIKECLEETVNLVNFCEGLDFFCIGGDITSGQYETKEALLMCMEDVLSPLNQCEKPIFILNGNHDDNSNSANPNEFLSKKEWNEFIKDYIPETCCFCNEDNCSAYYYDIIKENRTQRIFCLDSAGGETSTGANYWGYTEQEINWLNENIKECDDAIILSHIGPFYKFNSRGITPYCNEKLDLFLSSYREKILAFSFGHMHGQLLYFEKGIKYSCTCSAFSEIDMKIYNDKTLPWENVPKTIGTVKGCRFDIFMASKEKMIRIAFGAYSNKVDVLYTNYAS